MATYHAILFFLLFLSTLFVKTTELSLSIGAILDTKSRIGREQKIATEVAIARINSSQVITLNAVNLRSNNPQEAVSYVQGLIQLGAQVIISSGTWSQLLSISDVHNTTGVPAVSLTVSAPLKKPFLVQLSYPDIALVNCLADFAKSYKWQRVIAVYEDDDHGTVSGTAQLLAYALDQVGTLIDYYAVFPSMDFISDIATTVQAELDRMKQHRSTVYIILRSSENLTLSLFQKAFTNGLMDKGCVWICGPEITTLLDSTLTASFILNHMQGVIGVEPYIKASQPEYVSFSSDFRQAYRTEYENNGETSFDPGAYAVRAYDALHAITLAANRSNMDGNSLADSLQDIDYIGLSGLLRPGANGSIKEESGNSTFRIVNVVGKSYKEIGYWSEGFGFYTDEPQLSLQVSALEQLTVVFWPGETTVTPGGLRKLKVGVPVNPTSYGFVNKTMGNAISFGGFCIDVFTSALDRLNYSFPYEFVPYEIKGNSTYDDLLNQVYFKKFDVAVADITRTSARSKKVSFSESFIESGLTMVVPLKRQKEGFLFTKPFHWKLWTTFVCLLCGNFIVIWYLENAPDFQRPWRHQVGRTFWVVGNTFFLGYGEELGNYYTKLVMISWLLVILILSSCYTANLSSILVTEKLKPVVDTSIAGSQVASFVVNYVERVLNYKKENIVPINVPDAFAGAFENGTITVGFMEVPYARIFLSRHENYATHGETQILGGFGFALQKGDPLTAELSKAILELQEDGTVKHLETKWFSASLSASETTDGNRDVRQSLGLDAFGILFVIYGVIIVIIIAHFTFVKWRHVFNHSIVLDLVLIRYIRMIVVRFSDTVPEERPLALDLELQSQARRNQRTEEIEHGNHS